MFELIGETLRWLRKERGLTLEDLRTAAGLGRGQLSRIENRKQEATLSTLAKILECQGVSRREFFRRYELVEAEALAVERQESGAGATAEDWPEEVRAVLSKVDSFVRVTLDEPRSVAQGAIEIGDLIVLFRVVPKDAAPATPQVKAKAEDGGTLKPRTTKLRTGGKADRSAVASGRKRKR